MLQLHGFGLTLRQIAAEVGCSLGTVQEIVKTRPVPSS